uniref:Uncharacterized protein n=1 Tax=Arundo donax TaxID=35708 RepID=A0A0A9E936_ARUDO
MSHPPLKPSHQLPTPVLRIPQQGG